ncbi:hypothetical protein K443DRAFT_574942 [Laccaria amethystina LaAM-08-1]|uniref:Uncharacterized protein n=1 Tax=Laccaria amethystina LaAM-08-1 TaxID=1095629 RepID=A0A0C9WRN6_9AGAR|nr:hypothetical protein K443DRAFT_574942 [Laccaria amethystina LaAM-08-1]
MLVPLVRWKYEYDAHRYFPAVGPFRRDVSFSPNIFLALNHHKLIDLSAFCTAHTLVCCCCRYVPSGSTPRIKGTASYDNLHSTFPQHSRSLRAHGICYYHTDGRAAVEFWFHGPHDLANDTHKNNQT